MGCWEDGVIKKIPSHGACLRQAGMVEGVRLDLNIASCNLLKL
jgi:hypothetical protein